MVRVGIRQDAGSALRTTLSLGSMVCGAMRAFHFATVRATMPSNTRCRLRRMRATAIPRRLTQDCPFAARYCLLRVGLGLGSQLGSGLPFMHAYEDRGYWCGLRYGQDVMAGGQAAPLRFQALLPHQVLLKQQVGLGSGWGQGQVQGYG